MCQVSQSSSKRKTAGLYFDLPEARGGMTFKDLPKGTAFSLYQNDTAQTAVYVKVIVPSYLLSEGNKNVGLCLGNGGEVCTIMQSQTVFPLEVSVLTAKV